MTKQEVFVEINRIQDEYIDELVVLINNPDYEVMKTINFTSPTGTGKTKMMSKLINRFPDYYFIVTTLSKGQLHLQVRRYLKEDCIKENFVVYGSADYKINSRLDAETIINGIPKGSKCIWLRDEGHIRTNRFDELLRDKCYKVINFSATNAYSDIKCNFTQTMMLRTVNQKNGSPKDAINKLLEIKNVHKKISNYNPCAIFRCVGNKKKLYNEIIELCKANNLKFIDITDDPFIMSELCEDNNEYDVIINKFKIVEGIDIRRAHVLYMDNQPGNNATTIQAIGRCRRNALLYRDDIDILDSQNEELLRKTRECFVYYDVENMKIESDEYGELQYAFCNHVSCQELKEGSVIEVIDGQLMNGLYVIELEGYTGKFEIIKDVSTGFNVVSPETDFYKKKIEESDQYIYIKKINRKININNIKKLPKSNGEVSLNYRQGEHENMSYDKLFYYLSLDHKYTNVSCEIKKSIILLFEKNMKKYDKSYMRHLYGEKCFDLILQDLPDVSFDITNIKQLVDDFIKNVPKIGERRGFYNRFILDLGKYKKRKSWESTDCELKDFFDENELLFISYKCIECRNQNMGYDDILSLLDTLIDIMQNGFSEVDRKVKLKIIHYVFKAKNLKFEHIYINSNIDFVRDVCKLKKTLFLPELTVSTDQGDSVTISSKDVTRYFKTLDDCLKIYVFSFETFYNLIHRCIESTYQNLCNNILDSVVVSYANLFEEVNDDEKKKYVEYSYNTISEDELKACFIYKKHSKIINDIESSVVGVDLMHQIKFGEYATWVEAKAVSYKVGNYNKLNVFISQKYENELKQAKSQCFTGENQFDLDKKCNSMLGYCVEYYSKYLVYGESYLEPFLQAVKTEVSFAYLFDKKKSELTRKEKNEIKKFEELYGVEGLSELYHFVVIRACMLKYRDMMVRSFGVGVGKKIISISSKNFIQEKYRCFVGLVIELGEKTAKYVKECLYKNSNAVNAFDPNLSIEHIAGLADYVTKDTILDVKVRNNIDENCIRQVLAYHYLSTKRSDLDIRRVIVYDATSNRDVVINITEKNQTKFFC